MDLPLSPPLSQGGPETGGALHILLQANILYPPAQISSIDSCNKQILWQCLLLLQNASNCCKYDADSISTTETQSVLKYCFIMLASYTFDMDSKIEMKLEQGHKSFWKVITHEIKETHLISQWRCELTQYSQRAHLNYLMVGSFEDTQLPHS